jgi:hypothetical protein
MRPSNLASEILCVECCYPLRFKQQENRCELKLQCVERGPKLVGCNRQEVVTESNRFLRVSQAYSLPLSP